MMRVRQFIAVGVMMLALRLCMRRDDATSLRICIPLTLAMITAMEGISRKGIAVHADALRDALAKMRVKLSVLEKTEDVLA